LNTRSLPRGGEKEKKTRIRATYCLFQKEAVEDTTILGLAG